MNCVEARFERQGHKDFYVKTLLCHIQSLHDTVHMWSKQVFMKDQLSTANTGTGCSFQLDSFQSGIVNNVMDCLYEHDDF